MGFDPDTKDGHRVFWPEKRSVSVERSIKFNFSDEAVVRLLPIEGETPTDATNPTVTPQKPTNTVEIDPLLREEESESGRNPNMCTC